MRYESGNRLRLTERRARQAQDYLARHGLNDYFETLSDIIAKKSLPKSHTHPDPAMQIIDGYSQYCDSIKNGKFLNIVKLLNSFDDKHTKAYIKSDQPAPSVLCNSPQAIKYEQYKPFQAFINFVNDLGMVLDISDNNKKTYLLQEFRKKCYTTNRNNLIDIRAFYSEIKSIVEFCCSHLEFTLEELPEMKHKTTPGVKRPDSIISKNNIKFQVECKTIFENSGHPINQEALYAFGKLLLADSNYQNICLSNKYCFLSIKFDKPLVYKRQEDNSDTKDYYTPKSLLKKVKEDLNASKLEIEFSNSPSLIDDNKRLDGSNTYTLLSEDGQHLLALTSSSKNTLDEDESKIIKKAIEDKLTSGAKDKNGDPLPIILWVENYAMYRTKNEIEEIIKEYSDKLVICVYADSLRAGYIIPVPTIAMKAYLESANIKIENVVENKGDPHSNSIANALQFIQQQK